MAIHSQYSFLENPMDRGAHGLQSMGSQRVGHEATEHACIHTSHINQQKTQFHLWVASIEASPKPKSRKVGV